MKKVTIMMSTFNGEKYIKTQIDSILNQTYDNIQLLIRDDGSEDKTCEILMDYEENFSNIKVIHGENVGVIKSFFCLLNICDDSDYYAFCDQDDYWHKNKILKAINSIEHVNKKIPILYSCNKFVCDENLNIIYTPNISAFKPNFGNSLVQNIITGTTAVFNNDLKKMFREPRYCTMHDAWIYQIAACFGEIILDNNCYVYYRQHGNNVVGSSRGLKKIKKSIVRCLNGNCFNYYKQAEEFIHLYKKEIPGDKLLVLDEFLKSKGQFIQRLKLINSNKIRRQNKFNDVLFKLAYILQLGKLNR